MMWSQEKESENLDIHVGLLPAQREPLAWEPHLTGRLRYRGEGFATQFVSSGIQERTAIDACFGPYVAKV